MAYGGSDSDLWTLSKAISCLKSSLENWKKLWGFLLIFTVVPQAIGLNSELCRNAVWGHSLICLNYRVKGREDLTYLLMEVLNVTEPERFGPEKLAHAVSQWHSKSFKIIKSSTALCLADGKENLKGMTWNLLAYKYARGQNRCRSDLILFREVSLLFHQHSIRSC